MSEKLFYLEKKYERKIMILKSMIEDCRSPLGKELIEKEIGIFEEILSDLKSDNSL